MFRSVKDAWELRSLPPARELVGVIVLALVLASGVRWLISLIRTDVPFAVYLPVVMLGTALGGVRAGVAALVAGAALGIILQTATTPTGLSLSVLLAIYVFAAVAILWLANHYRSIAIRYKEMADKLRAEEDYRELLVGELSHRLKNKLATAQAIIHQVLRKDPETLAAIDHRLRALSATDNLIASSRDAACELIDLFRLELGPYASSRVSFSGPAIRLDSRLAVSLALLIHELATNSSKYGVLSVEKGLLQVTWNRIGQRVSIVWDESNGPAVEPPTTQGFGTRLMRSALAGHDGKVTVDYMPSGLHCVINCRIDPVEATTRIA